MHLTVWGEQYDVITKPRYVWQRFAVLGNNYCAKAYTVSSTVTSEISCGYCLLTLQRYQ